VPSPIVPEPRSPEQPEEIGPFRILEVLGEGGMGTVYLAEQRQPVRRRVALKVVRLGLATRDVLARFEAERQALAMMSHPHIAKVFDAGTTPDGRPYFAMEYVAGVPVTEYCDRQRLDLEGRLQLFVAICQGIQHAHQKGIVHRDIKPSNILVQMQDGTPVPKIIDFGVAKALEHRLTEKTLFTEHGRIVGTPEYMSPEQAEMSGLAVDTRTDIYSLGVVLYELLVGNLPFDGRKLREAGYFEIQRQIREVEPPKPSTRISTMGDGGRELAQQRRLDAAALTKRLRGDLDWITMKAIEKDPTRRYQAASEFASDVMRFLAHEPVTAGPPSATYRLLKFARRHRGGLIAAAAVMVSLVAGLVGVVAFAVRAKSMEAEARASAAESTRLAGVAQANAEAAQRAAAAAAEALDEANHQVYVASISACATNLDDQNYPEAWRRLRACPPDFRQNWEWRLLALQCDSSLYSGSLPASGIIDLKFGARGDRVFFALNDGSVWTAFADREPSRLVSTDSRTTGLALDERNTVLVTNHDDGTVRLWDPETGAARGQVKGNDRGRGVAVSRDGMRFAAGIGSEVRVWAVGSHELVQVLPGHSERDVLVAIDANGGRVWTADYVGVVRLFDVSSGALRGQVDLAKPISSTTAFALDRSERWLGYGNANGEVVILAATDLTTQARRAVHEETVNGVAFTPDGSRLVSVSTDATIKTWDVPGLAPLATVRGSRYMLTAVDIDPTGNTMVASEFGPRWRLWETVASDPAVTIEATGLRSRLEWGAMNRSGSHFAVTTSDGRLRVFEGTGGDLVWEARVAAEQVRCLAWDDPGRLIVVGADDGRVSCYDVQRRQRLWETKAHARVVDSVAFRHDGTSCFSGSWDDTIAILDARTGAISGRIEGADSANSLRTSKDDRLLLAGMNDFSVRCYDLTDRSQKYRFRDNGHVGEAIFTPDEAKVCVATTDDTVKIRDLATGNAEVVLQAHKGAARCVTFSPDGRRLFSGGDDGTIRVWDLARRELLATLRPHRETIVHLDLSDDGQRLFSASTDGRVCIQDLDRARTVSLWRRRDLARRAELRAAEAMSDRSKVPDPAASLRSRTDLPPDVRELAIQLVQDKASGAIRATAEGMATLLRRRHLIVDDALAALAADASVEPDLRAQVEQQLRSLGNAPPGALNTAAWNLAKQARRSAPEYARAERLARAASAAEPADAYYCNTWGVALYRTGRFAEAIAVLERADQLNRAAERPYARPSDQLFIAMCQFRLGQRDTARTTIEGLRATIERLGDAELVAFLEEAEQMLEDG